MAVQVKVGSFIQAAGTGLQSVTGVGFEPNGLFIFGNMIGGNLTRTSACSFRVGVSDGTHHYSYGTNSGKVTAGAAERSELAFAKTKCFIAASTEAGAGLTAAVIGTGYINSFEPDGFVVNFDLNQGGLCDGTEWHYMAIGGSATCYVSDMAYPAASGTLTVTGVPFAPTALIGWRVINNTGPGIGSGAKASLGFAASCGPQQVTLAAAQAGITISPATSINKSYQHAGVFTASIDTTATIGGVTTVTSFTSDGFVASYTGGNGLTQVYMAIGGCAANVGTFNQKTTTGAQAVTIDASAPHSILMATINKVTSAVAQADFLASLGASDGTAQTATWTGDLDAQASPYKAAEGSDTTFAMRAYTPTGNNTATSNTTGTVASLAAGTVNLNWATVSGTAWEWFYLVLADDFGSGSCGVGGTTTTYPIRRERIFLLPSVQDYRMFLQRLELLIQAGVGLTTGQGRDPTFTVEVSRDGGQTYGTVSVRSPGALGDYAHRAFLHRLGYYRQGTVRIAMSDPVLWALLEGWMDLEKGLN